MRFCRFAAMALTAIPFVAQTNPQEPPPATMQSAYGQKLHVPGIPNAGKINDSLYRGAQPNASSLAQLKALGVTLIVNLRAGDVATRDRERKEAESLGLRFVNIPVGGFSAPTNEQVAQFLALFRARGEKVFVHCRYGDDRTGVFVATYRMAVEKWPAEKALKEMYFFGFNGRFHPAMISFVRDFPARLTSAPALAGATDSRPATPPPHESPLF